MILCAFSLLMAVLLVRVLRPTPSAVPQPAAPVLTEAGDQPAPVAEPPPREDPVQANWGIEVTGLRLAAGGNMLDFRYKVVDPNKADSFTKQSQNVYLIDEATGTKLPLPDAPRTGAMRRTAQKPLAGHGYFLNFPNPERRLQTGSKVTLVMGNFKAENLVVQ